MERGHPCPHEREARNRSCTTTNQSDGTVADTCRTSMRARYSSRSHFACTIRCLNISLKDGSWNWRMILKSSMTSFVTELKRTWIEAPASVTCEIRGLRMSFNRRCSISMANVIAYPPGSLCRIMFTFWPHRCLIIHYPESSIRLSRILLRKRTSC